MIIFNGQDKQFMPIFERLLPKHFFWLSIAAAIATIVLKTLAWWITDSVGLLSDALESFVNLAGASAALLLITLAHQPPDREHPFGHGKAEYFSSAFEAILIFGAAIGIAFTAVDRFMHLRSLSAVNTGLIFSAISTIINGGVAYALMRAATRFRSIALQADARHLLTDVWTSVGVFGGVLLVDMTGILWLDPLLAILVAANIVHEAWKLLRLSLHGLLDEALTDDEIAEIETVLGDFSSRGVMYKNLRTRRSGAYSFVNVDILVPADWRVDNAHLILDEIEAAIELKLPHANVITHLEPVVASWLE